LELGLKLVFGEGYRTACYVEREAYAAATLVARMEDETLDKAPVWDDIKTFRGRPLRGLVDIVSGGYPCQPFSVAGKMLGTKDPRHIWPHIAHIVEEVHPEWCFFENVAGHLRLGFEQVQDDLRRMGFLVAAGLFTAAEVGASHRRERLFILARRAVANPRCRRPEGTEADAGHGRGADAVCLCAPLADSDNPGDRTSGDGTHASWPEKLKERPEFALAGISGHGKDVADAEGMRFPGWSDPQNGSDDERISKQEGEVRLMVRGATTRCCGDSPAGVSLAGTDQRDERAFRQRGIGIFPPAPSDLEAWRRILETFPEAEPSVRGMADGMAPGLDRLRLCGNGVVPLAAAYAFITLRESLGNEEW
jgi:DNA (cytosine-5)-methyltransferase 1